MSDERFDLSYKGLIAPGADPERTRRRLSVIFKLSDTGAERLFTGRPVIVKRDVDAATAERFQKIFSQAGATLTVTPVDGPDVPDSDDPVVSAEPLPPPQVRTIDTSHLALAAQYGPLEEPPAGGSPVLDISHLGLVTGDWTLEDCESPPTPIPEPDISNLSLEPAAPRAEDPTEARLDQ